MYTYLYICTYAELLRPEFLKLSTSGTCRFVYKDEINPRVGP